MDKKCDACEFLKTNNPKHRIALTDYWDVGVGNNQAYFGRAYATLRTHKESLGELSRDEWQDFEAIVKRIEEAYKAVYGAEPINWGCFMNHAFREEPFNPHVHWHIFPRYKQAPILDEVEYDDPLFGNFYDDKAERLVNDDVIEQIAGKLVRYLESH